MLAMGASRYEATADLVGRSIRLAMTPLLNTMSVVGLVSIPGMMTGQVRRYEGEGSSLLEWIGATEWACTYTWCDSHDIMHDRHMPMIGR
jgi:hypothetical protein